MQLIVEINKLIKYNYLYLRSKNEFQMLIIPIKDGENIDKALKRFKRKFDKTGVMRSLRERKQFVKPSIVHRTKIKKAQYIQRLKDQENL